MGKLRTLKSCHYCRNEPFAGWVETDNNGPIVPCPVCNNKSALELEYEKAVAARALQQAEGGAQ